VGEDPVEGGVAVGAGVQPSLSLIGRQDGAVASAEPEGRGPFPGVGEAVDPVQGAGVPGVDEGGQHPAGAVDDPDLRRVTDQDDFRCVLGSCGREAVDVQGGGHRGLIDDQDRPVIQAHPGPFRGAGRDLAEPVASVEPLRDGVRVPAGRVGEFRGGPRGGGETDDPVPGLFPCCRRGPQGPGLTGPGGGGQDRQEVPVPGQLQHRLVLPPVQPLDPGLRH